MYGCPVECLKNDWNCAYKHMGVVEEDHFLQVIEWEKDNLQKHNWCSDVSLLISSIIEAARLLILIVQKDVKMGPRLSVQQLDDNNVADEMGSDCCEVWDLLD